MWLFTLHFVLYPTPGNRRKMKMIGMKWLLRSCCFKNDFFFFFASYLRTSQKVESQSDLEKRHKILGTQGLIQQTKERLSLYSQPGNCLIPYEYTSWVTPRHLAIDPELVSKRRKFREMSMGEMQCDPTQSESWSQDESRYLVHPADL